jgi:energy-coupling factor transporter transmembrane protein EcfT
MVTGSERPARKEDEMIALLVLLLILAVFGGLGFAAHFLWFVLIAAVILWVLGFFVGGLEGGRRHWYGRW